MCWCESKNPIKHYVCEKDYIWNPCSSACKIYKHLKSIIGDTVVTFDEIIESTKITPITFNEKNATCRIENFYTLLTFFINLHITIYNF